MANWNLLQTVEDVTGVDELSARKSCLIFKHSTRCSISSVADNRLRRGWDVPEEEVEVFYLDLIKYRDVSNYIADHYGIRHESPQVLLIRNGQCIYDTSHLSIDPNDLKQVLSENRSTSV